MAIDIGFLVFPGVTQLDFTGPLQVLSRIPHARIHVVWKSLERVPSDTVLTVNPTVTFAHCPQLNVICIPGGGGTDIVMNDLEVLRWVSNQSGNASYVTSVCTGALVLGAAGLLDGYEATTHWSAMNYLELFGAIPVNRRVCIDRDRITGGGVTAGIDFGLSLAGLLAGPDTAEMIQLSLEYDPEPPFQSGSPASARPEILKNLKQRTAGLVEKRKSAVAEAATRWRSLT